MSRVTVFRRAIAAVVFMAGTLLLQAQQPELKWESPAGVGWSSIGWFFFYDDLSGTYTLVFYHADNSALMIMDGPLSSTPRLTIPFDILNGEVAPFGNPGPPYFGQTYVDISGDGVEEYFIDRFYSDASGNRSGFRIVDGVNGNTLYIFDDPNYSYDFWFWYAGDIDGDGMNELVVRKSAHPNPSEVYQLLVYSTPGVMTAVGREHPSLPAQPSLMQNYPNPFNPSTIIRYELSDRGQVDLSIYNNFGQRIRRLVNEVKEPGSYRVIWDGRDDAGAQVSSGVYFYQVRGRNFAQARKMVFLK